MEAPGDWLLDSGWGDCQLVSALFASMCRARGIPARILGGFYLYRTFSTNHYWAEAWIDGQGWMPFDFSCWDLSRGGQDPAWRDYFFGRLDCRLTNQCLPLDFTGSSCNRHNRLAWRSACSMSRGNLCIAISFRSSVRTIYFFANFWSAKAWGRCGRVRLNDENVRSARRGDVGAKRLTHGLKTAVNHNNDSFLRQSFRQRQGDH
jgi:hypothetical protein